MDALFLSCFPSSSCWPAVKLQIITSEGASGDYPGCTDLAYTKAASDGADVLNCPVQMTKDGIPFCLGSINLIDKTTAAQSPFSSITTTVPELKITNGILTINLTWTEIQSLRRKLKQLLVCSAKLCGLSCFTPTISCLRVSATPSVSNFLYKRKVEDCMPL